MGLSVFWYGLFCMGCNFLDFRFCVLKFGIKTYVPIFKLVADGKREFICD